jgi:hypothetical protein
MKWGWLDALREKRGSVKKGNDKYIQETVLESGDIRKWQGDQGR